MLRGRTWARATYHLETYHARQVSIREGRAKPRVWMESRPKSALGSRNQSVINQSNRPSFTPVNAFCVVNIDHHQPQRSISQRSDGMFDLVDCHLHEWTMGTSTPSELITSNSTGPRACGTSKNIHVCLYSSRGLFADHDFITPPHPCNSAIRSTVLGRPLSF